VSRPALFLPCMGRVFPANGRGETPVATPGRGDDQLLLLTQSSISSIRLLGVGHQYHPPCLPGTMPECVLHQLASRTRGSESHRASGSRWCVPHYKRKNKEFPSPHFRENPEEWHSRRMPVPPPHLHHFLQGARRRTRLDCPSLNERVLWSDTTA